MTRTLNNPFMRFSVQLSDEETAWSSSQRKTSIVGIYEVLGRPLTDLTMPGVEGCQKVRHGGITGLPRGDHKPAPCSDGNLQHDLDKERIEVQIRAYVH